MRLVILIGVTTLIRSLNNTPRWGMIAGNGQSHSRAITQRYLALHQALTKATATHKQTPVPVLHSTSHNLASRRRRLINHHNKITLKAAAILGIEIAWLNSTTLG